MTTKAFRKVDRLQNILNVFDIKKGRKLKKLDKNKYKALQFIQDQTDNLWFKLRDNLHMSSSKEDYKELKKQITLTKYFVRSCKKTLKRGEHLGNKRI